MLQSRFRLCIIILKKEWYTTNTPNTPNAPYISIGNEGVNHFAIDKPNVIDHRDENDMVKSYRARAGMAPIQIEIRSIGVPNSVF